MIDTHTHIYAEEFDSDRGEVVARAQEAGVTHLILPNIDLTSAEPMLVLHRNYPDYTSLAWGLHPTSVTSEWQSELAAIRQYATLHPGIAIGEVGLDFYWDTQYAEEQKQAFTEQLEWAVQTSLPVIIHQRKAFGDVMNCLQQVGAQKVTGIFHSFGEGLDELQEILDKTSFMIGINGIVTFKNNHDLRNLLKHIPLNRLVLETDAPYLTPMPHRGKRNEPAYLRFTAQCIADSLDISIDTLTLQTAYNSRILFAI